MRFIFCIIFFLLFFPITTYAQKDSTMVVPFTLSDKIRLIRMEEQMNAKFEQIDKRFEQIDKRFEQIDKRFEQIDRRFEQIEKRFERLEKKIERLEDLVWASIFTIFGAVFTLIGFILWDRRTFLKPIALQMETLKSEIDKQKETSNKVQQLINVLKEKAQDDEKLQEILKKFNLW
ncbi:MAG: hypothetical protein KatS3mg035_1993 [Bacteroidia bacterium]|nr:MAG: hypothetical protein KatS3mg035_1993 [Bacteroidia bacterium]